MEVKYKYVQSKKGRKKEKKYWPDESHKKITIVYLDLSISIIKINVNSINYLSKRSFQVKKCKTQFILSTRDLF